MAQFRSCAGIKHTGQNFPVWDDDAPEGLFFFGEQTEANLDNAPYHVLWINMPYRHPDFGGTTATWHCFPVVPGRWTATDWVDEAGTEHRQIDFVPRQGAPIPPHEPWWQWDGDEDHPTLKPSIICGPVESPHWHGHMQNGTLTGLGESA